MSKVNKITVPQQEEEQKESAPTFSVGASDSEAGSTHADA